MSELALKAPSNTLLRLRAAARELFVRDGYHTTRPQDIARVAGVANGTFYLHFKDKKVAFLDFAAEAQTELVGMQKLSLEGVEGHRERWRVIFDVIITFGIDHPGVLSAAFLDPVLIAPDDEEAWHMYNRMGEFIGLAMDLENQNVAQEYDMALISHAICGMLRHALTYASRNKVERKKLIDDLSLFIDRGLGFG